MPLASGQSNLFFNKETKVYIEQGANIWELPVLNGYSFDQSTNSSEVTLSEMSDATGGSRRGTKMFTDSFAPSEWSFDTYARPYLVTGTPDRMRAVEEVLWANFVAPNAYTAGTPAWTNGVTYSPTALDFDFDDSNKILLGTYNIYFVLGAQNSATANYAADAETTIYKITGAVANEVSISFDIEGIATLSWSGMGGQRTEVASFNATTAIRGGVDLTNNFIRNRLTQMSAVSSVSGSSKTYAITLTGGSITISNGITFLTPEVLGRVNQPLGHITGTRSVSGNFTAYMDEKTNGSIELLEDLSLATTAITNQFALDFYIGGKAAGDLPVGPGIQFKMPQAHLSLPSIDTGDVIAVSVDFKALPTTISGTDEISKITYVGV
jgi:Phage tail tube protein